MKAFFSLPLFLIPFTINAQTNITSIVNTCGGNMQATALHLEWSVGEMTSVDWMSSPALQLTNGLLQGDLQLTTAIPFTPFSANEIKLYPNPVQNILLSRFQFSKPGVLHIQLTDATGRHVASWKNTYSSGTQEQLFPVQQLSAGVYIAELFFIPNIGNTQKGTYTIIKQ